MIETRHIAATAVSLASVCIWCLVLPPLNAQTVQAGNVDTSVTAHQPDAGTQSWPDTTRYRILFWHVAALQELADSREKTGNAKSAAGWRTHDQRLSGVDEAEGRILTTVAADCNQALKDQAARSKAAIAQIPANDLKARPLDESMRTILAGLRSERDQIVQSHIDSLKSGLTESSFLKLDAYLTLLLESSNTRVTPAHRPASRFRDRDSVLPGLVGGAR